MYICEILQAKQPETFVLLCNLFGIDVGELLTSNDIGYFDPAYEMAHDSEDRYLNYSSRGYKLG